MREVAFEKGMEPIMQNKVTEVPQLSQIYDAATQKLASRRL